MKKSRFKYYCFQLDWADRRQMDVILGKKSPKFGFDQDWHIDYMYTREHFPSVYSNNTRVIVYDRITKSVKGYDTHNGNTFVLTEEFVKNALKMFKYGFHREWGPHFKYPTHKEIEAFKLLVECKHNYPLAYKTLEIIEEDKTGWISGSRARKRFLDFKKQKGL